MSENKQPRSFAAALENFLQSSSFAVTIIKSTAASFENGWMIAILDKSGEGWKICSNKQVSRREKLAAQRGHVTFMYVPALDDKEHERLMQAAAESEPPASSDEALAALLDGETLDHIRSMLRGFLRNL